MSSLAWYAGRAAAMSPREMVWRAQRAVDAVARKDGLRERPDRAVVSHRETDWDALLAEFRESSGRPILLDRHRARGIAAEHPAAVRLLIDQADRIIEGERSYFGYPAANVGRSVKWNHDPMSGHHWPAVAARKIDHRVADSDPKWIWELNRLQHLPILAQAWLFTGDARYAETALAHLDSWMDDNPPGRGVAWRGAFEAGVRAASVAIALQGLRTSQALTTRTFRRAVRMLDASARYCWIARSRFSSANNHLLGELAGLATVHLIFPEIFTPARLFDRALATMTEEADRLILPDGAGAEQSISYQMFAAELLVTPAVLLLLRGDRKRPTLTAALDRSADYLASLVGSNDPDPRYGDDDDSFALKLGPEPKRTVRAHLGITAAVTGNVTAARYGETTLTAAWIASALGTDIAEIGAAVGRKQALPSSFAPDGGLVVLRDDRRRLTMDVGPLGYLSTAAHGHADALSVTLSADGHELIVDPGTGSFYGHSAWRDSHRGTRAHATVCLDGLDQSVIGGQFYWKRAARTAVRSVNLDRGVVDAEHDGYRRLDDPVTHRRWLVAAPDEPTVAVIDLLDGHSVHDVAVSWPLHPDLHAEPNLRGHRVSRNGSVVLELLYAATSSVETEQVRGDATANRGWWSDRLEARMPAWWVGARCRTAGPVALLTVLHIGAGGVVGDADVA
ncbi:MAG TPA: alginate lyase family protein, partial [Mycobacterium sp.]|nr:alginate lyase family protein [Mycobacterium sp.]